jgi:hypothetical protein
VNTPDRNPRKRGGFCYQQPTVNTRLTVFQSANRRSYPPI